MKPIADTLKLIRDRIPAQADGSAKTYAEIVAEDNARQAEEFRRSRIASLHKASGVDARYRSADFAHFERRNESIGRARDAVMDYAANWDEYASAGRCAIIIGEPGTGKTHLVCALVNALCERGFRAQYSTFAELVKWLRSTWRADSKLQEMDALRQLWDLDLLVIDEVGAQKGTEGEQQHAFEIIDKRYRDMKPTIVLGNTGTDGILTYLGARIVDRLLENGGLKLKLDGKSARTAAKPARGAAFGGEDQPA